MIKTVISSCASRCIHLNQLSVLDYISGSTFGACTCINSFSIHIHYNHTHWSLPGKTRSTSIDLSISHATSEFVGPVLTKILTTPSSSFVSGIIKLFKYQFHDFIHRIELTHRGCGSIMAHICRILAFVIISISQVLRLDP